MRYLKSLSILLVFALFAIPSNAQTVQVQSVATVDVGGAEAAPSGHAGAFVTVRPGTYGVSALGVTGKHDRSAMIGPTMLLGEKNAGSVEASVLAGVNQNRGVFKPNGQFAKVAPNRTNAAVAGLVTYSNGPVSATGGLTVATGLYDVRGNWYWPDWKRSNRLQRTGLLFGFGFRF